jgi:hypothetical protein
MKVYRIEDRDSDENLISVHETFASLEYAQFEINNNKYFHTYDSINEPGYMLMFYANHEKDRYEAWVVTQPTEDGSFVAKATNWVIVIVDVIEE